MLLLNLTTGLLADLSTAISSVEPVNISISSDGQTAIVANISSTSVDVLRPGENDFARLIGFVFGCLGYLVALLIS